jgi:hypothetical protein
MTRDEAVLRRLLAFQYAGHNLYADDGELQDNTSRPVIDFKRDSVDAIEAKMMERSRAALAKISPDALAAAMDGGTKGELQLKFFDLPLGTVFRYIGGDTEWVILERHGCGKIAEHYPSVGSAVLQGIFNFADSEEECRTARVVVRLSERTPT